MSAVSHHQNVHKWAGQNNAKIKDIAEWNSEYFYGDKNSCNYTNAYQQPVRFTLGGVCDRVMHFSMIHMLPPYL